MLLKLRQTPHVLDVLRAVSAVLVAVVLDRHPEVLANPYRASARARPRRSRTGICVVGHWQTRRLSTAVAAGVSCGEAAPPSTKRQHGSRIAATLARPGSALRAASTRLRSRRPAAHQRVESCDRLGPLRDAGRRSNAVRARVVTGYARRPSVISSSGQRSVADDQPDRAGVSFRQISSIGSSSSIHSRAMQAPPRPAQRLRRAWSDQSATHRRSASCNVGVARLGT